ncbi:unnamed protein product [Cladocopium goreaui]|uniref:Reverse transcriptase domain-containing protein n=1 Tax=Cladocopium goreaui TaxID=2562237 RepID=A0A9P1CAE7_9DINO|nr:unnamed protein product [Cladocopium goreaui]
MDAYSTYRRCTLRSLRLAAVYWTLSGVLAVYVLYTAITSKNHLLQEVLSTDAVLFARFEEEKDKRPKCAEMNATGLCVELPWLDAVEVSASRGFLATYMEEALFLGRPALQRLGAPVESQQPRKVRSQGFYVGQPELWSLVLEDRLASIAGTWSSQDLAGFMREDHLDGSYSHPIEYAANGLPKEVRVKIGGHKNQMDRRVKVSMSELLSAANVTLDQECSRCAEFNLTGERARLRRVGLELDLTLFYSNLWFSWADVSTWFLPNKEVTFELRVQARQPVEGVRTIRSVAAAQSFFDARDYNGTKDDHPRVTRRSFGIRLLFHQQGVIGRWDPMTLAFFCLQSCTFLGVAWTLTELLCTFIPILCDLRGRPAPAWLESLQRAPREKKE